MGLIVVGVAVFVEAKTDKGLTPTLATFLGSIVASFHVANYAVSKQYMDSRANGKGPDPDASTKLDAILRVIKETNDPEISNQFTALLRGISTDLAEVKAASGQMGVAVLNIGKQVNEVRHGLNQR